VLDGSHFAATTSEALIYPHPIPPQHTAAGTSSGEHMSMEESDEDTNMDVFLNMAHDHVLH
jgi:hypothetical protein